MRKRIVTYDVFGDDYDDFYDFLNQNPHKKLTESTYEISSNLDWEDFCRTIYDMFHVGDTVYIISTDTESKLLIKKIRG